MSPLLRFCLRIWDVSVHVKVFKLSLRPKISIVIFPSTIGIFPQCEEFEIRALSQTIVTCREGWAGALRSFHGSLQAGLWKQIFTEGQSIEEVAGAHKRELAGQGHGHCFVTGTLTRDGFQPVTLTSLGSFSTGPFWPAVSSLPGKARISQSLFWVDGAFSDGGDCFMQKCVAFSPGGMPDHPKPSTFRKITASLEEALLGGRGTYWPGCH